MRIMGFTKKWPKLYQPEFTTFRFPRKDRPWAVGEMVQTVYHPRGKDREVICHATIITIEPANLASLTEADAIADGFESAAGMIDWMERTYPDGDFNKMIKITLRRIGK